MVLSFVGFIRWMGVILPGEPYVGNVGDFLGGCVSPTNRPVGRNAVLYVKILGRCFPSDVTRAGWGVSRLDRIGA